MGMMAARDQITLLGKKNLKESNHDARLQNNIRKRSQDEIETITLVNLPVPLILNRCSLPTLQSPHFPTFPLKIIYELYNM